MKPMPITIRPAIASLPVYKAGRPAPTVPEPGSYQPVSYKLSSNENPYPPLADVLALVEVACGQMNRYPDAGNAAMIEAVAERLDVGQDQLAFGTGSVAVLYHLLQAVCDPGDEVVFAWRSFEAYPIAVQATGASCIMVPLGPAATHDLDALRAAITDRTKAVMLCSPNNPTGPTIPHDEVVAFIDAVPDHIMIMIDEAYVEFVTDPAAVRGLDTLAGHPNVVLLRTFSKAYGLAGFRVGFCVADPTVASAVRAVSLPFGVSVPAQAAVIASLAVEDALLERVAALVKARMAVVQGMRDLGFDIPDAQGNFFWLPAGERTLTWAGTFADAGLMVRPFAGDGIRISIGEQPANCRVLEVAATLNEPQHQIQHEHQAQHGHRAAAR